MKLMRGLVRRYKTNPNVRMMALSLTSGFAQKDWGAEVRALHSYVRDNIRYLRDVRDVETIQTPDKTLEFKQGDCDDKSLLLATMLESIGHPTKFVAISQTAGNYCHVYVETKIKNSWVAADATEPQPLGWQPQAYEKLVITN